MIETFVVLLLAHTLADFLFQTEWMVRKKAEPGPITLHIAIVLATSQAAIGSVTAPALLYLAAAHLVIDLAKVHLGKGGLLAFLMDQAAHILSLGVVAAMYPDLWASGFWAQQVDVAYHDEIFHFILAVIAFVWAVRAGEFAIGILMRPLSLRVRGQGLPNGGRLIGWLERAMILLLVGVGQPAGIGFLIGAKSILRFGTASKDQKYSEYVIIGTLASFAWALAVAYLAQGLSGLLPPLEIGPQTP